ncbi:MAG: hypothetical protein ACRBCK_10305 [Alphaproteobacteria bacterium]
MISSNPASGETTICFMVHDSGVPEVRHRYRGCATIPSLPSFDVLH